MSAGAILVIARQAGAAAALAPVVGLLRSRRDTIFVAAPTATAHDAFELAGTAPDVELPPEPTPEWLRDWLRAQGVAAVLTGTSFEPDVDRRFWTAARELSLPSVAVLDHWFNYAERFSDQAPFDSLPDVVAVMDEGAASDLRGLGVPDDRLRVTGHPHLDEIVPVAADERATARVRLGVGDDRAIVTFASEPIRPEETERLRYTGAESLDAVRSALRSVEPSALLIVRPHPREDEIRIPSGYPQTVVTRLGTPRDALAASDVLTGMTSMMLLEGALAGIPVLSVRPNGGADRFIEQHLDLIRSVTDPVVLPEQLRSALKAAPRLTRTPRRQAARQVLALLDELIQRGDRPQLAAKR